jgi:hypothetical protein
MGANTGPDLLWFVARGSGMVAFGLLTLAVVLGIAVSERWHTRWTFRLVVEGAHRWATLIFFLLILVHSLTVLLDPFTHFGLRDVLIPLASAYRTFWLGLGIVATELGLAIGASVWLRRWIGYRAWHALHLLTYLLFPLSVLHGLGTGTDTRTLWATVVYAAGVLAVLGTLVWRTLSLPAWRRPVLTGAVAGALALVAWSVLGPYAPGWAEAAGTPASLLQAAAQQKGVGAEAPPANIPPAPPMFPSSVSENISGQTLAKLRLKPPSRRRLKNLTQDLSFRRMKMSSQPGRGRVPPTRRRRGAVPPRRGGASRPVAAAHERRGPAPHRRSHPALRRPDHKRGTQHDHGLLRRLRSAAPGPDRAHPARRERFSRHDPRRSIARSRGSEGVCAGPGAPPGGLHRRDDGPGR